MTGPSGVPAGPQRPYTKRLRSYGEPGAFVFRDVLGADPWRYSIRASYEEALQWAETLSGENDGSSSNDP